MSKTRCTIQVLILSVFMCVFTAVVSYAQAEAVATGGEVLLRLRPTEAASYPMRVEQAQNTTVDLGPMGQQEILANTVFEGKFKVKPLSGGGLEMETVYDRFTMKMNQMGQETVIDSGAVGDNLQAQVLQQMTGKPITVQLDDTGRVLGVSGFADLLESSRPEGAEDPRLAGLTEMIEQAFSDDSMSALMQQSQAIYPQDAVRVGDTWTSTFDVSNAAIGEISAASHYKLVEMAKYRGRDAARLDLVMDMDIDGDMPMMEQMNAMFAEQGGLMDIDFGEFESAGSLWIDLETGLTLDSTIDQTFDVEMNLEMPDREMTMTLSVESVMRSQFFEINE